MKFGSVGWAYTPVPEDMPCGDSLERIADQVKALGFDIVDYLSTEESLDSFFTPEKSRAVGEYARGIGLQVGGLVFQRNNWNDPDPQEQEKHFAYLEKCLKTAVAMGAGTISCILPGPFGARPNPRPSPSDKIASNLPEGYCWQKDWDLFAANMRRAAEMAAGYGVRVALECFPGTLCSTPHAMLKLLEEVNHPNLGIQLDTAHLMNQNIDIETAIYMLGGSHIFNVHAKDSDGLTRTNLAPGCGLVDYRAVLRALKNVGYTGNISVEVEFTTNPAEYMRIGIEYLKRLAAEG